MSGSEAAVIPLGYLKEHIALSAVQLIFSLFTVTKICNGSKNGKWEIPSKAECGILPYLLNYHINHSAQINNFNVLCWELFMFF